MASIIVAVLTISTQLQAPIKEAQASFTAQLEKVEKSTNAQLEKAQAQSAMQFKELHDAMVLQSVVSAGVGGMLIASVYGASRKPSE